MNLKEIREIIHLMNENDLSEIEVQREGSKIKIRKSFSDQIPMIQTSPPPPSYPPAQSSPATSDSSEGTASKNPHHKEIPSPMVGTFYRAPSPEAPPFADIGQMVEVGQVVCIVEAMKLMNEIKSEIKGKIVDIAVENAQPVEFGQPLFIIEPV